MNQDLNQSSTNQKKVVRKLSRPVNEFGGNLGCLFYMIWIPWQIYYFYGCLMLNRGQLMLPTLEFHKRLMFDLPPGLSILPTTKSIIAIGFWVLLQVLLEIFVPGQIVEGVPLKNGRRLKYPMNGLTSFFITHVVLFFLYFIGVLNPRFVFENMGSLLTWGVIIAYVFALWLYIDFGIFWKRHVNDPEFEEDWGVFNFKDFLNDFFLGVVRNPRIFHFLKIPFDVKRFWNARPGLTLWVLANFSMMSAQYYNCRVTKTGVTCSATGSWNNVTISMWFICINHWYYILDYNWNERAYLTTTDIRHDLFGWMLTYGDFGFLPWFYSFSFSYYLVHLPIPLNYNTTRAFIGIALGILGMTLFRLMNSQKDKFRTYYLTHGHVDDYKIWGKPAKYLKTEEGSILLYSGFWGLARHFNYVGDLIMCVGWLIACSGSNHAFPWVPLGYVLYFYCMDIHRSFRDEDRCLKKYKKDWVKYQQLVPYRIIPGVI